METNRNGNLYGTFLLILGCFSSLLLVDLKDKLVVIDIIFSTFRSHSDSCKLKPLALTKSCLLFSSLLLLGLKDKHDIMDTSSLLLQQHHYRHLLYLIFANWRPWLLCCKTGKSCLLYQEQPHVSLECVLESRNDIKCQWQHVLEHDALQMSRTKELPKRKFLLPTLMPVVLSFWQLKTYCLWNRAQNIKGTAKSSIF